MFFTYLKPPLFFRVNLEESVCQPTTEENLAFYRIFNFIMDLCSYLFSV